MASWSGPTGGWGDPGDHVCSRSRSPPHGATVEEGPYDRADPVAPTTPFANRLWRIRPPGHAGPGVTLTGLELLALAEFATQRVLADHGVKRPGPVEQPEPAPAPGDGLDIPVMVRNSTLEVLREHTDKELGGSVPISDDESVILLSGSTLRRLIEVARPGDKRLDDVVARIGL
jgi:hypothetical protein